MVFFTDEKTGAEIADGKASIRTEGKVQKFVEAVEQTTAENVANYSLDNSITVNSATRSIVTSKAPA